MADAPVADATEAGGSDAQVTFKVKSSGDKNHTITMSETAKVIDLKTKLAGEDFENVPVERQRLIYSGRVMRNDDMLSVYKIKSGNTIHMVKSAASNPAPPPASASSAPTPQAIPQNMAAGTSANNLLAGLTGARFAGHANLPSADLFGADGGMGAPPSDEQIADILSNPAMMQSMNEALNNPAFVDMLIQQNPALRNLPNAREMLQSPFMREMMMNPDLIRATARMRRAGAAQNAFPAPGATDTTPEGAPASRDSAQNQFANPWTNPFLAFGPPGAGAAANPFASLMGGNPFGMPAPAAPTTPSTTAGTGDSARSATTGNAPAAGSTTQGGTATSGGAPNTTNPTSGSPASAAAAANPFAALFGPPPTGDAAANNPFGVMTPEALQNFTNMMQQMQGWGQPSAPAPVDNRPPEERYADQLRQLNDMGFYDFDRNVAALRRSGGSVQGAIEHLLGN